MINFFKKKLYFIFFSIYKYLKYPKTHIETNFVLPGVEVGEGTIIRSGCKILQNVKIGSYTYINENTIIDFNCKSIGNYCSISHGVKIGMGPHPLHFISTSPIFYEPYRGYVKEQKYNEFEDKGYTIIGNDVLIGANAIILAGVNIGDGAVIGAGSVVAKDVPPYAIVAGNPAKIIRYRFNKKIIDFLLKSKWWLRKPEEVIKNFDIYNINNNIIKKENN